MFTASSQAPHKGFPPGHTESLWVPQDKKTQGSWPAWPAPCPMHCSVPKPRGSRTICTAHTSPPAHYPGGSPSGAEQAPGLC